MFGFFFFNFFILFVHVFVILLEMEFYFCMVSLLVHVICRFPIDRILFELVCFNNASIFICVHSLYICM